MGEDEWTIKRVGERRRVGEGRRRIKEGRGEGLGKVRGGVRVFRSKSDRRLFRIAP